MKGTKQTRRSQAALKRRPRFTPSKDTGVAIVARQLRIPRELDNWLISYAQREGFTSEVDAVRHVLRDFRERDMQVAA